VTRKKDRPKTAASRTDEHKKLFVFGRWAASRAGHQSLLAVAGVFLMAGGIVLAVLEKGDAPTTALIGAGLALVAAAAFFDRVREIGPQGVKLDPLLDRVENELPPARDPSAAEERKELLDALRALTAEPSEQVTTTRAHVAAASSAEAVVSRYARGRALEQGAREWLIASGWQPVSEPGVLGRWRPDLVAEKEGVLRVVEAKAGHPGDVEQLAMRLAEARALLAHERGVPLERVEAWLAVDVIPPAAYLAPFRREGIGVVRLEPSSGVSFVVAEPRSTS
jgi:hypothetical protein